MKKRIITILLILVVLAVGGIIVWKWSQSQEGKTDSSNQQKDKNPSLPPLSKERKLEKYLLEKRLDLEKYFVFSVKELKLREKDKNYQQINNCQTTNKLTQDLTKLAAQYEKKIPEKGYKLLLGEVGNYTYFRTSREWINFCGQNFSVADEDWAGEKINENITKNENRYIIFEKNDEFENTFFAKSHVDEQGNQWYSIPQGIFLRMKTPSTRICESKEKALEIIKTDPALAGKF